MAKNLLWVAKIISLFDFFRFFRILKISLAVFKSKLPVGSSARIISGSFIIALAIATRWDSPPDSWEGKWFNLLDKPILLNKCFALLTAVSLLLSIDKLAK